MRLFRVLDNKTREKMQFMNKFQAREVILKPMSVRDYMQNSMTTIINDNGGQLSTQGSIFYLEHMVFKLLSDKNITVMVCTQYFITHRKGR